MIKFTPQDLAFMTQRGSNSEQVEQQFAFFNTGFDFANIQRNVSIGDGIVRFSDAEIEHWINIYDNLSKNKEIVKFVPASGAATRMFKDLYEALQSETVNEKAKQYKERINDFAFFEDLKETIEKKGYAFEEIVKDNSSKILIEELLNEEGLNYGNLPKGLLKFHKYKDENRTALEEHLVESVLYAQGKNGVCQLHFTVSESHLEKFVELATEVKEKYEKRFGVIFQISYSIQSPSTDTLAAELNFMPFRDKNGNLLFRPGGHGALINNLNNITADLVFVKNIDNVVPEKQLEPTIIYKKALAGYLLHLQEKNFEYQNQLINNHFNKKDLPIIIEFAKNELMIQFEEENPTVETVLKKLNRPMRICGVVKNEGEPGGGPFWITNRKGETSLQIVESSQIDMKNPEQKNFMASASHFNPVDLVCCYKGVNGKPFNLNDFVDPYTGFISEKSYEGRSLLAMELPGLWNGAMADWITIFAEVPLSTFNPVKTVFDLLKRIGATVLLFCFLFSAYSQSSSIVILHTNDTHSTLESYNEPGIGDVGGVLRRHSFIQQTRNQYPNIIVADAGDFSQGTPYFNLFQGVPEIELMNMLGYDVVAIGNHEFDNGSRALAKRLKLANFKIVCANYKFKNNKLSKLVKPYAVFNVSGTKIGFFGLLCDMKRVVMPNYYQEVTFLDPVNSAQKTVELLKNKEQCDIIICLSHLGFDAEFPGDITDKDLAEQVSGIDFVIGGHTHKLIEEPVIVGDTKILQAGKRGIYVGKIMIF